MKKNKKDLFELNDNELTLLSDLYFELKDIKDLSKILHSTILNLTSVEKVFGINTPENFYPIDDGLKVLSRDIVNKLEVTSKKFDNCYLDIIKNNDK